MLKNNPIVISEDKIIEDFGWGRLMTTPGGWIYLEREGINSVAFVLRNTIEDDEQKYGLLKEYIPSIDQYQITAFSGTIDKPEYNDNLELLVKNEVMEESGFNVDYHSIHFLDKVFSGKQSNEFIYLFMVDVDRRQQQFKSTRDVFELSAEILWMDGGDIAKLQDWRALTILAKTLTQGV